MNRKAAVQFFTLMLSVALIAIFLVVMFIATAQIGAKDAFKVKQSMQDFENSVSLQALLYYPVSMQTLAERYAKGSDTDTSTALDAVYGSGKYRYALVFDGKEVGQNFKEDERKKLENAARLRSRFLIATSTKPLNVSLEVVPLE